MLACPSHALDNALTLSTNRCRPLGSASAMPITAAVISVLTGCRLKRPSDDSDICACRSSQVTGLRLRRKPLRVMVPGPGGHRRFVRAAAE
jgi:hypothetical protein